MKTTNTSTQTDVQAKKQIDTKLATDIVLIMLSAAIMGIISGYITVCIRGFTW